jgi:hypothetical protein
MYNSYQKHKIICLKFQQDICDVHDIFKELAGMVEEQGEIIGIFD